jgi:hypothetical protein
MINNKTFEHRPIEELMAIVRQDFKKLDDEGMIDEGNLIKTVMYCNDRLGIGIREVKQVCIPVEEYKAKLPLNFEKLYFTCALKATNTMVAMNRSPFDNNFDRDIIYEAEIDRDSFGGTDFYGVTIKRQTNVTIHSTGEWVGLDVFPDSHQHCHLACPNTKKKGKYSIRIVDGHIETPFRCGELYIMYIATMCDDDGNLLFPFHPMITPYYEWSIKEKVLLDAIFNSDLVDTNLLALAQREKVKAWLDAYDMTTSKGFGEYVAAQRRKEFGWYNQYFKFFQ